MNESAAVEIKNLRKLYGKFEALKGVDLRVERGTIFGLLGANGAGKSTMIKILVGSSQTNGGEVQVLGLNPFKDTAEVRSRIGYMPQAPALYEDLSARDNINFFGTSHRLPNLKQRVDEVLEFTELSKRQRDPAYAFSGGMKQRLSLACAIVHEPEVLFLDEPTAGVDPKLREAFWKHFRELANRGHTLFVSTHLMDEAMLCDKLAIMAEGEILACDTPKSILRLGNSRVHVWHDGSEDSFDITNYPVQLPGILQKYNLNSAITKIEIEEDTLETIMLRMIDGHRNGNSQKEATHA
jgi:ABC-2 type transport system ATP-binding protein